MHISL